jgi:4-hydroxy-tetrahydrodipicolinate synthase
MAAEANLGAILTAMVTPFGRDGRLNEQSARRLMGHLVEHGSDGVVIAGTTGESPTMSDAEKLELLEIALDELGGEATVVAGTGSNDTAHSVELTRAAGERGADAVLVVTPYYNKPPRRGIVEHFKAVAAATDRPLFVYNIPGRTGINLDPDLLAELAQIDNVVAVKQANPDMDQARRIVEDTGLALYAGDDNLMRPFAEIGGAGGICVSSHIFGDRIKEMYQAARAGDGERAREIDGTLADAYETLTITQLTITIKAALNLLGFEAGVPRLPLVEASEREVASVRGLLERQGLVASAA